MNFSVPDCKYLAVDRLAVEVHPSRVAMGRAAARAVAGHLHRTVAAHGGARVVFACAPSQDEFLDALAEIGSQDAGPCRVDWSRITAFHMDDYVGLKADHPASFRHYLREHLLSRVRIGAFHPIPAEGADAAAVCGAYAALLAEAPIDLICLGIGENGHIAFNDPPVDFDDPQWVKPVTLDDACRRQQVNDGCFPSLEKVPSRAITLTPSVFRAAKRLSIHVPGPRKAPAVKAALRGAIFPACPASILRLHPDATLYLEPASASQL